MRITEGERVAIQSVIDALKTRFEGLDSDIKNILIRLDKIDNYIKDVKEYDAKKTLEEFRLDVYKRFLDIKPTLYPYVNPSYPNIMPTNPPIYPPTYPNITPPWIVTSGDPTMSSGISSANINCEAK
jgi:hypothetical protein